MAQAIWKNFAESLIYHIFWVCEGYLKFDPLTAFTHDRNRRVGGGVGWLLGLEIIVTCRVVRSA